MALSSSNTSSNVTKVAGTAVDVNTGNASAGTQRVVLATNQPAVAVTGSFYQATQPVSLASVPTHGVTGTFWQATQPVSGPLTDTQLRATAVPVSGTFYQATQPVSASALPLPTGAATSAKQPAIGTAGVASSDVISVQGIAGGVAQPVSGTFWQTTQPVSGTVTINPIPAGTNAIGSITNTSFASTQSGTWNISTLTNLSQLGGTAISMNTGVRDAGTQRVTIATNDSVAVTGTFYQATQPVSIASMPTTAVTGPLTDAQLRATAVPVSGTVTANAGTGNFTVTQATAANLNATVTGTVELGASSLAALENISVTIPGTVDLGTVSLTALETITVTSGTPGNFQSKGYGAVTTTAPAYTNGTDNALSLTTSGALRVDNSGVTQPVSGTFWQATQPVSGPLTDAQLRAAAVPVSLASVPTHGVTGTFWQATQPVSIASMPTTPVTGTFWQATQPVSGTITAVGSAANGATVSGNPVLIGASDGSNARTIKVATDGTLLINGVQDARQTSNITSASSIVGPYSVSNRNVVTISISGSYAGVTFVIEATDDGTNWYSLQCINNATGQAASTWTPGTNALASYDTAVGGYTQVRVRATAWTSGTAVVGVSNQVFAYDPIVAALSQGLAANGSAVVGAPVLMGGSDGTNARNILTDTTGALKNGANAGVVIGAVELTGATTNALTNTTTTAYAASLIIKASAGTIYTLNGFNSKSSGQFIQLHNSATLPADNAVPVVTFYVPASSNFSFDWGVYGRSFSAGIVVTTSSTGPTKTIGAADCWFDATSK